MRSTCKLFMIFLSVLTCAVLTRGTAAAPVPIWITQAEINALPQVGDAWEALLFRADNPLGGVPLLADIDNEADIDTLAKALVYARTGIQAYKDAVIINCNAAIGTEDDFPGNPQILGLSRNLLGYVIAAQLIGPWDDRDPTKYSGPTGNNGFRGWLIDVRTKCINNTTLIRTHEERPSNFGTNAGASRMAADLYINTPGSRMDFASAAITFKGWLGDVTAWPFCSPGQPEPTGCNPPTGCFNYGLLSWQSDPANPRGINPLGAVISDQNGPHNVDGVLPDDLRRACSCDCDCPDDCDPEVGSCCEFAGAEGCFAWPIPTLDPMNPSPARY